jgi:hypothetical protein
LRSSREREASYQRREYENNGRIPCHNRFLSRALNPLSNRELFLATSAEPQA